MNRVLIHQDKRQIKNYKDFAEASVPHLQAVYSAFLALGITVSLEQINEFAGQVTVETKSTPHRNYGMVDMYRPPVIEYSCDVSGIVRNLLMAAQTEAPAIGNLKLDNNKLKEMIQLPDTTALEKAFVGLNKNIITRYRNMQLQPDLYEIEADKVQLVADADEQITEMWSYYATSPKEIELNAALSDVAGALNQYAQYMSKSNMLGNEMPKLNGLHYDGPSKTYQVDHYFVTRNAKHIK